ADIALRGDKERVIRVVLHGLTGPVTVAGQNFGHTPASVPMPAMGGLEDAQLAELLTFVRGEFGAGASPVTAAEVKAVRAATAGREKPWTVGELTKRGGGTHQPPPARRSRCGWSPRHSRAPEDFVPRGAVSRCARTNGPTASRKVV
ncbi:MAG: hypothetical protein EB034_25305, partial [Verrucomicrobia bacterium]|nr:hypothetical protein [Verrucomicrobiota bacterium]